MRVEWRLRAALDDTTSADAGDSADAADEFQMEQITCKNRYLVILWRSRAMFLLTFLGMSRTKAHVFRPLLDKPFPKVS